jgi:hypothetical protein
MTLSRAFLAKEAVGTQLIAGVASAVGGVAVLLLA